MKKLLTAISFITVLYSCNTGKTSSPKSTVKAFIEASKEGDVAGIKKYITRSDAGMLEIGESFLARFDSSAAAEMKEKMSKEFKEKATGANIEIKDEKIEGDNAIVNVQFTSNGKTETRPFSLVKEDGQWKISLLSTGMKNAGTNQQDMQETMKGLNLDSMQGAISEGMKEFNKMNKDSLKKVIEQGMKDMEKLKDIPKEKQ